MIVVSAPGLWPLLRNTRWFADSSAREQRQLKPYKTDPPGRNSEQKRTFTSMLWPSSTSGSRGRRRPRDDLESEFIEEGYQLESTPPTRDAMHPRYGATGSEERIVCSDKEEDQPGTPITVTTEVSVLHIEVGQGTASKVAPANVRRPDR